MYHSTTLDLDQMIDALLNERKMMPGVSGMVSRHLKTRTKCNTKQNPPQVIQKHRMYMRDIIATSFPGSVFSASFNAEERDPGWG